MRALLALTVLLQVEPHPRFELPTAVDQALTHGRWKDTPRGFRAIVLSHIADGCVGQARSQPGTSADARRCVEQALAEAKKIRNRDDGLVLSHVNLIYGAADQLGPCLDAADHQRITRELVRRAMKHPLHQVDAYRANVRRWPADHSVTLASIARYDHAHGTQLLEAPLTAWKDVIARHQDATSGLPESEITGADATSKLPRGCAQSYMSRYLLEVDPSLARTWWTSYRQHFLVEKGVVVGFREWPRGVDRAGDIDSGPIVWGIGTAASAFAISAARAHGDLQLATRLEASAALARATPVGGEAAQSTMAEAITFEARWQPVFEKE